MKKVYLAGPLFSQAELKFNIEVKEKLSAWFKVFLPQEDGQLLVKLISDGFPPKVASKRIFQNDIQVLEKTDLLIIILDGRSIDEGAAFELGFAYAMEKNVLV